MPPARARPKAGLAAPAVQAARPPPARPSCSPIDAPPDPSPQSLHRPGSPAGGLVVDLCRLFAAGLAAGPVAVRGRDRTGPHGLAGRAPAGPPHTDGRVGGPAQPDRKS